MKLCNTNQLRAMPITASQLQRAIQKDPVLSKDMYHVVNGWPKETDPDLYAYRQIYQEFTTEADCLLCGVQVVVQECLCEDNLSACMWGTQVLYG